jgi:hypothetical protein
MKMTFALVVLCLTFGASPTQADIITSGIWSPATPGAFYDGLSADCATCGIGFLLADYPNLEYLHDADGQPVPFWYVNETDSLGFGIFPNEPPDTTYGLADLSGAFYYDNSGTGHASNSLDSYWQWVLFRTLPNNTLNPADWMYLYFLGVEDTPRSEGFGDRDYNDLVFAFDFDSPSGVEGAAIPEPMTLVLFGLGLLAVRRKR